MCLLSKSKPLNSNQWLNCLITNNKLIFFSVCWSIPSGVPSHLFPPLISEPGRSILYDKFCCLTNIMASDFINVSSRPSELTSILIIFLF